LENICIPAFIANKSKKEATHRAEELLSFLGLTHRKDHKPNELSGDEQQRVAVARALSNNPTLILDNEPSEKLDTETTEIVQTFVIVTHNTELVEMADRKVTMQDGIILR